MYLVLGLIVFCYNLSLEVFQMHNLKSWGNYPKIKQRSYLFNASKKEDNFKTNSIPYGNGRSYGDSCLSDNLINLRHHNHFLSFDSDRGTLTTQSGVLLEKIIELIIPYGWFLMVVPGTKKITVGGAIASDIHGKNHHIDGCFSECVEEFKLLMPNGQTMTCSRNENIELFQATCGGMGLTGVITEAKIKLVKVHSSEINQSVTKTKNLYETFKTFEAIQSEKYSVAWIDCLSKGKQLGRSHVIHGHFANNGNYIGSKASKWNVPFFFPSFLLNKWTVRAFNFLYYHRQLSKQKTSRVGYNSFFFPLDSINNWNKIYGKKGFTQYQFILPKAVSYEGIEKILKVISQSGKGSFLAVLKLYGKENDNFLSFPIEGYSLALDFKIDKDLFKLLDQLDNIVVEYGGRIYLSKDARVKKEVFEKGYPRLKEFKSIRSKYNLNNTINSNQSLRLGI